MKRRVIIALALLSVATFSTAGGSDAVTLKRVAKKGDSFRYRVSTEIEMGAGPYVITGVTSHVVTKVSEDGSLTVTSTVEEHVAMLGDSEMPSSVGTVGSYVYSPSGLITQVEPDMNQAGPTAYQMASLTNIMWPTKKVHAGKAWTIDSGLSPGSSWTVKIDADSERGVFDTTCKYRIIGRERLHGFDCFKIKFACRETSGGDSWSKGVFWIDVASGLTVKFEGTVSLTIEGPLSVLQETKYEIID